MTSQIEKYQSVLAQAEGARVRRRSDVVAQHAWPVIESHRANQLFSGELDLSEPTLNDDHAFALQVYGLIRILVVDQTTYLRDQAKLPRKVLRAVSGGTKPPCEVDTVINLIESGPNNPELDQLLPMTLGGQSISWRYELKRDQAKLRGAEGYSIDERHAFSGLAVAVQQEVHHLPTSFSGDNAGLTMEMRRSIGLRGILPLILMEHALLIGNHPDYYSDAITAWNNFILFINTLPIDDETKRSQVNLERPAWLQRKVREGLFPQMLRAERMLRNYPVAMLPTSSK